MFTLEARGADALAQTAHDAADRVERDVVAAWGEQAGSVVLAAVDPPIDTGRLASTVHLIATPDGFAIAAGGEGAPYAAIVNARQPFMSPAFTDRESAVVDAAADQLERLVGTIKGA